MSSPNRKKRIFIGPWETAGYYKGLSQGMLELGENVMFVLFHDHPFAYGGETHRPFLVRLARGIARRRPERPTSPVTKTVWWLLTLVRELLLMAWSLIPILRCDVFIFGTGNSLWRKNTDLWILSWLGKRVVLMVAHGGELRPPYMDGSYQSKDGTFEPGPTFYKNLSKEYRQKIRRIEKFNFTVIGSPLSSAQFATKKMVNVFNLGIPIHQLAGAIKDSKALARRAEHRAVRVLHAPSHPIAKGTSVIRQALEKAKAQGIEVDYREITGQPHNVVREALLWCDFVVDQVYSDGPLAGLASEAAMLGKPSVVGGFGLDRLIKRYPHIDFPIALVSKPSEIQGSIEKLALDEEFRMQLGEAANRFVLSNWTAKAVAEKFLMLIENRAPETWNFCPDEFFYFEGYGQDTSKTKERIRELVGHFGISSLQLDHNKQYRDELLAWAFDNPASAN